VFGGLRQSLYTKGYWAHNMARLTREQSQAVTRDRLLEAAGDVVAEYGYDGASVDLIAETAGYSKGAFYSNFSSKEDVLHKLLEGHAGQDIVDLTALLAGVTDPNDVIEVVAGWSGSRAQELKWGLLAVELLRRERREGGVRDQHRAQFSAQWSGIGELLFAKLFPEQVPAHIDPLELGGMVLELTYGGIAAFLDLVTVEQMVRQMLIAIHSDSYARQQ
jgi:AcrR family transcriptional regulator